MKSAIIHYVQPVTFYSFLYMFTFHLFSNISKTVSSSNYIWFCTEFQLLSFDKKKCFNQWDNRREISKILREQFFMGNRLHRDAIVNRYLNSTSRSDHCKYYLNNRDFSSKSGKFASLSDFDDMGRKIEYNCTHYSFVYDIKFLEL